MSDPAFTFTVPASTTDTLVEIDLSPVAQPAPAKLRIGTNIADNKSLPHGSALFANAFNSFTGWYDGIQGSKIASYDANGFPTMANGLAGSWGYLIGYSTGTYTLKYRGPQNAISIQGKTFTPVSDGAGG